VTGSTVVDGLRLVALGVRVLVHVALGGAALAAVVTVASVLGPYGPGDRVRDPRRRRDLVLTRLSVTRCAADATTSKVEVPGAADGAPPVDTWVTVTGTWHPEGELGTDSAWPPVVDASAVRRVRQPAEPYEQR
jgi:hypothetical protein